MKLSRNEVRRGGSNKIVYERIKEGLEEAIRHEQGKCDVAVTNAAIAEDGDLVYGKTETGFSTMPDLRAALETNEEEQQWEVSLTITENVMFRRRRSRS